MDDNQLMSVVTDHWIMRNPMVRIPLEAYFREQFDKKIHEKFNQDYMTYFESEDGSKSFIDGVDYSWVGFQLLIVSNLYPIPMNMDHLKAAADWYIDKNIDELAFSNVEEEIKKQRILMHEEELTKKKALLERCYRKHIFIYCVFMMAVIAVWQFSWVSAIALSISLGCFSETERYMNFLKRICKGKEKNDENANKNDR